MLSSSDREATGLSVRRPVGEVPERRPEWCPPDRPADDREIVRRRGDGRPHLSPNWFFRDGERFFISTTRDRVKFKIFSRDPRSR